ncbi:hypothetical protein 20Sep420_00082 [Pseudomonas phage 20Sep420]|nr:hypothetical protein 20Sep420_00082 [Pseudomonas phage 20Sep420]
MSRTCTDRIGPISRWNCENVRSGASPTRTPKMVRKRHRVSAVVIVPARPILRIG